MDARLAIRLVVVLLLLEVVVPALLAGTLVAERGATVRALSVLPLLLAIGLWTGRRLAQVVTRGYAGLQVLIATGILVFGLVDPRAPFFVFEPRYIIPRSVGLFVMLLLAVSGGVQWYLLGLKAVRTQFAAARW